MATIKITKFGGIRPRIAKHNLADHMATVANDVDLSEGVLQPWQTDKDLGAMTGLSLWVEDCCKKSFDNCFASIAYDRMDCKRVIATDVKEYPVTATLDDWCKGEVCRLGFPCDMLPPSPVQPPIPAFSEFSHAIQVRTYAYRYRNKFGEISAISSPSYQIQAVAGEPVTVTLPPTEDGYCITAIEILRSEQSPDIAGNNLASNYFLVGEVDFGVTTFIDGGQIVDEFADETMEFDPPPDNLKDVQYWQNGQFTGMANDNLYVSEHMNPSAWPTASMIGFTDKPRAHVLTADFCFVATDSRPVIVSARSDESGCRVVKTLEDVHPIIARRSLVAYNNHAIYATKDGLVMLSGTGQAKVITADHYSQRQWRALHPETMFAVIHDGHYFGFFKGETIRFRIPDSVYEDHGDIGLTTLSIRPSAAYRSLSDELYFIEGGKLYQWNAGSGFKEFEWQSAVYDAPEIVSFAAFKVQVAHDVATVEHWVDQERIDLDAVATPSPTYLPMGRDGLNWQINVKSRGVVSEYSLSTSINDLGRK